MIQLPPVIANCNHLLTSSGNAPLTPREIAIIGSVLTAVNHDSRDAEPAAKKPELAEVRQRAIEIGLPLAEASRFYDYFESNGWKIGKNPMKNWKSALSNWQRTYIERTNKKPAHYAV